MQNIVAPTEDECEALYESINEQTHFNYNIMNPDDMITDKDDLNYYKVEENNLQAFSDKLKCFITCNRCNQISLHIRKCRQCQRMLCESCSKKEGNCDNCRDAYNFNVEHGSMYNKLRRMAFKCDCFYYRLSQYEKCRKLNENNIRWQLEFPKPEPYCYSYQEYISHCVGDRCEFTKSRCPLGCTQNPEVQFRRGELKQHFMSNCQEMFVKCLNCQISFKRKQTPLHVCQRKHFLYYFDTLNNHQEARNSNNVEVANEKPARSSGKQSVAEKIEAHKMILSDASSSDSIQF